MRIPLASLPSSSTNLQFPISGRPLRELPGAVHLTDLAARAARARQVEARLDQLHQRIRCRHIGDRPPAAAEGRGDPAHAGHAHPDAGEAQADPSDGDEEERQRDRCLGRGSVQFCTLIYASTYT